jgi:hypothetical protein
MRIVVLALISALQVGFVQAEGFAWPSFNRVVGVSRLFNNDFLGDGQDRWRSGSYEVSVTFGPQVLDGLPRVPFELMQYRFRGEVIAPADLSLKTAFPDRPYAGVIGLGAFTHYERGNYNISYGGELVFVGPSTGIGRFQKWAHDALGTQAPNVLSDQLPDKIYPTIQGEVSRDMPFGGSLFRPFAEAQVGVESYARVGFDAVFGHNISRNFFVRDPITGHLITNVRASDARSFGFVLGGDMAFVGDSKLLPESRGYAVRRVRPRARAGFAYEGESAGLFYGLTWLGKEFVGQKDSQVTGSLNVKINF